MHIAMTIINDMIDMAVECNGLFIPGQQIEYWLSKYCVPLGYWTGCEEYPITIPGSATLIKYRGTYLMVCTRHQISRSLVENLESVCIMLPENGKTLCITSGGHITFNTEINEGDHNEIALFDFTEPVLHNPNLIPMFFDFREQHQSIPADKVIGILTYGYPIEGRNIDYEGRKLGLTKQKILCKYKSQGNDDAIHIIQPLKPLTFSPDGMSGGPAFAVVHTKSQFSTHLAGINVRGGKQCFRIIKAGAIQMMMDALIDLSSKPDVGASP